MAFKHIIFDCDGVLVDSEPLSMRADVVLLRQYGAEISEAEAHSRFVGKTFEAMVVEMAEERGIRFPAGLSEMKNRMLEDMYERELRIVAGVADTLADLKRRGFSLSVASNSPKSRVALALRLTGITAFFDGITSFEDVKNGKPAPDVFLMAATAAGVAPSQCLAIEDSTTGVTAAVAARMHTIGFVGTHHEPADQGRKLAALGAAAVIGDMRDLTRHLAP